MPRYQVRVIGVCVLELHCADCVLVVLADCLFSQPFVILVKLLVKFATSMRHKSVEERIFEEMTPPPTEDVAELLGAMKTHRGPATEAVAPWHRTRTRVDDME